MGSAQESNATRFGRMIDAAPGEGYSTVYVEWSTGNMTAGKSCVDRVAAFRSASRNRTDEVDVLVVGRFPDTEAVYSGPVNILFTRRRVAAPNV